MKSTSIGLAVLTVAAAVVMAIPAVVCAQTPPPATPPPSTPPPFTAGWQDGFVVQSANGDYRLVLGLTAQADGRFSLDDPLPITNTFTIRKMRPTLSGRVAKYFDFKVMPDFGNGTAVLLDAYFDIRFSPKFRVRSGKDKTPVGYELLQGDAFLLFPERALASSLVPNRDVGCPGAGRSVAPPVLRRRDLQRRAGRQQLDGGRRSQQQQRSSRAASSGSRSGRRRRRLGALNGLGLQIGGSTGRQAGALAGVQNLGRPDRTFPMPRARRASGGRQRVSPAVFYYYKSFGAFAEYMRSTQAVARAGTEADVTNQGWDVTGSLVSHRRAGVGPRRTAEERLRPCERPLGRAAVRRALLGADGRSRRFDRGFAAATASREAKSFTLGVNWYPVAFIKYYATFERTSFDGGNASRPAENVSCSARKWRFEDGVRFAGPDSAAGSPSGSSL